MVSLFIIFVLFNLCFAGLFGRQLSLRLYLFLLLIIYLTVIIKHEYLSQLDVYIKNQLLFILTFFIYKQIKISFVIFLALVLLLSLNINKLVGGICKFLISVFNEKKISYKFISLTIIFGSFVGRQISIYLDLSIIKAFLLIFSLGFLTCYIIYGILIGFFILGMYYAELWGNAVFTYLLKKTSESVQQKLKLNNLGPLNNQQKRKYSSGNHV